MKLFKFSFTLLVLHAIAGTVIAGELNVLSAGAVEPGVKLVVSAYEKNFFAHTHVKLGTGPQLKEYLSSGQQFDVLIAPRAFIEEQVQKGQLLSGELTHVGKVGAGIVTRKGAHQLTIDSLGDLKSAILAADRVVYNKASTGIYLDQLFIKMGIGEAVARKAIRYADGESVLMHIAKGSGNEIGFGAITEIKLLEPKGLQYVGPLPSDVQNYTSYSAGLKVQSPSLLEARRLLKQIETSRAAGEFQKLGIE